jgi:protein gp37
MNKQDENGIRWTTYTWNPTAGCMHRCQWAMPDGAVADCYAGAVAHGLARGSYAQGFEHHYWHSQRLSEPITVKTPSKIFVVSMGDLMGHWVPPEHIEAVIQTMRDAHWHTFQVLTKASPQLLKFDWPKNVWLGVSSPPDSMMGQDLNPGQKIRFMRRAMDTLAELRRRGNITFMSFEPLSWGVAEYVKLAALSWAIIGAASRGATYYQPERAHLDALLAVLDGKGVPVFYKGNLRASMCDEDVWREEYPDTVSVSVQAGVQLGLW